MDGDGQVCDSILHRDRAVYLSFTTQSRTMGQRCWRSTLCSALGSRRTKHTQHTAARTQFEGIVLYLEGRRRSPQGALIGERSTARDEADLVPCSLIQQGILQYPYLQATGACIEVPLKLDHGQPFDFSPFGPDASPASIYPNP